MGNLLITISGAREEILRECPTERVKFQSLGWAVLITSGIAAVSMWFALNSALGLNPVLAFPLALLWGLVIMGIDRWLITSIPSHGSRRWTVALPRLLLAVLLGTVISTPIVLRIFQTEINNKIAQIDTQQANAYLASQRRSQIADKVNYWQTQVNNLQNVIRTRGQTPLNFSTDPQIHSLSLQLDNWIGLEQKYYNQWQCQLYGIAPNGLRCKRGNGPLAQSSHNSYEQAKQQVSNINGEISARKNALSANSAAAAATRLREAKSSLPHAMTELQYYQTQQDNLRNQYESSLPRNGLLIRLQALSELSAGNGTVLLARILIFLLFLAIECLPVTVKLMQRPGNYELALDKAAEYELRRVYRHIRASEGLPERTVPADMVMPPRAVEDHDADVRELWQPTVTAPGQGRTMGRDTHPEFPGSAPPRNGTDFDLRTLDVPPQDEGPETPGGTPLSWDDDDG